MASQLSAFLAKLKSHRGVLGGRLWVKLSYTKSIKMPLSRRNLSRPDASGIGRRRPGPSPASILALP